MEFLAHRSDDDVTRLLNKISDDINPSDPSWLYLVRRIADAFFHGTSAVVRCKVRSPANGLK